MDLTDDEELVEVFTNCYFYQDIGGVSICRGCCAPCINVIEEGKCEALIEYFNKSKE